jgi:hypothetical protein
MAFNSPELVRASQRGDLEAVRQLVAAGADINSVGDHGMGPLLAFTPAVVEYLLSQGADPNRQTNESGDAVLIGIAYLNLPECVRLLLAAGADPKAVVKDTGETALHAALAGAGDKATPADRHAVVKLLLDHGAAPNARTSRRAVARVLAGRPHPRGNAAAPRGRVRAGGDGLPPARRRRRPDDPRRQRRLAPELGQLALASQTARRPARPAGRALRAC